MLLVVLYRTLEARVDEAILKIEQLPSMAAKVVRLRLEELN